MRDLEKLASLLSVDEMRVGARHGGWSIALRLGEKWMSTEINLQDFVGVKNPEVEIGKTINALAEVLKRDQRESFAALGTFTKPAHPPITGRGYQPGCMCVDCLERESEAKEKRPGNRFEALAEELKKL